MIFRGPILYQLVLGLGLILGLSTEVGAQNIITRHSPLLETYLESKFSGSGLGSVHYNIRPFAMQRSFKEANDEVLRSFTLRDSSALHLFSQGHFIDYKKKWFGLEINPIYHSLVRYGTQSGFTTELIAGLRGDVLLGKNFVGHFSVRGGGFRPVAHVDEFMNNWNVSPGQGSFGRNGYFRSFFDPSGYLSYSPSKHFK